MASLKEQSEKLFNSGLQYSENGQFENAIECYSQVINLTIDNRPAYPFSWKNLEKSSEKEKKEREKEHELNPNLVMAYFNRGKCKQELKDYLSASFDYKQVIELANNIGTTELDFAEIYYNIGICEEKYEDFGLDSASYDEIVCGMPVVPVLASSARNRDSLSRLEPILDAYSKAIELNPNFADAYNNRGSCYMEINAEIIEYHRIHKEIKKDYSDLSNYYHAYGFNLPCYAYYKLTFPNKNYHELALDDFNKAIELNPSDAEAYFNRAVCYTGLGKYDLALADYSKAIELNPTSDSAYNNRSQCHLKLGKEEIALNDLLQKISLQNHELLNDIFGYDKKIELPVGDFKKLLDLINEVNIKKNKQLEETNKQLELEIQQKEAAHRALHEKEKEMLSFFTHTMRNALATAPESLRQAIRLLGSEDYEKNQKHYEAINEITSLFSTLSLTDCLIDTFKQSIYDTEEFKRAWQQDTTGEATPQWFIAAALRQSLNRIIFMPNTRELRKLLQDDANLIKPTRKAFIEQVLPLDIDQQGVESFYHWINSLSAIDVSIEESTIQFGVNQIKFSLLFSITSELILNALKYWSGTGQIQIRWYTKQDYYLFTVKNACKKNASSNLAGTHKGLAFIERLMELLDDKTIKTHNPAQFKCYPEDHTFTAELKLHKTLLENNS